MTEPTIDHVLAARERMTYQAGRLVSCQVEQLQAGSQGKVVLTPEPPSTSLRFEFTPGGGGHRKTGSETSQKDTLVNDMIAPFVQAQWDSLNKGVAVKFRYAALERAEFGDARSGRGSIPPGTREV